MDFTHLDKKGKAKMVDVSKKNMTMRTATAKGKITLTEEIIKKILNSNLEKGDVITVSRIAGIEAAKKTWDLIPLCHQIKLSAVDIKINLIKPKNEIEITAIVKGQDVTGVEMEALTAVSVSLLTIYDMCKAISKEMLIKEIRLIEKTGGKSDFINKNC
jgi:cyclic pyranopterin phosphate synthase